MNTRRFPLFALAAVSLCIAASTPCRAGTAPTTTVVHSFTGDEGGEYPSTDLVLDAAGNLYGTTVQGGAFGGGTVFMLSPSGTSWTHTVLYSFTGGADGGQPYGGVTLDDRGNLYGTCVIGGSGGICAEDGCGVVYKLTNVGGTWVQKVIHDFTGADGSGPGAGVTVDASGNVYGMTPTGGDYGLGVIYRIEPRHGGQWFFRNLHTFTGGTDGGSGSAGRLLLDAPSGTLFGVATTGGANGQGVVFRLAPSQGSWTYTTLYAFQGEPDGGFPYGGLVRDASGAFYGTTYYDGEHEVGTVYKLAFVSGSWSESVLYSFQGGMDGASPISNLVFDSAGNLYGTTSEGGAPGCGCGTIFRLTRRGTTWSERVAHRFENTPDGAFPYNGMVSDGAGHFYGTTVHGGANGEGAIYQFSLSAADGGPGIVEIESAAPSAPLLLAGAPNPFHGSGVTLHYALPEAGHVRLAVYGVDGRLVRVLRDAMESAGGHDIAWDGLNDQGAGVSRGAYVCVMEAAGERTELRMMLAR